MRNKSAWFKYGYLWITLVLFLGSLAGHWVFAWFAFVDEQQSHGQRIEMSGYAIETARDTLENWQSEFLQLMWQVGGLAILLYVGSPQSREGDDRKEEKIDLILRAVDKQANEHISRLDEQYARK
jgi:hypothetical protein